MRTIGVIPARFAATRFMGKVLADLGGKPVIQHVWENARQARTLDDLIIAADDEISNAGICATRPSPIVNKV